MALDLNQKVVITNKLHVSPQNTGHALSIAQCAGPGTKQVVQLIMKSSNSSHPNYALQ